MGTRSDLDVNQSGKSGGDAVGSAAVDGGHARGYGEGLATGWGDSFAAGVGIGDAGSGAAGDSAGAAMGGDVSDNTSIGSVNINS